MGIVEDAELGHRHPGVVSLVRYFDHAHLPPHLAAVSAPFGDLVITVLEQLPDSPELTVAVRKLLEAKDCAVRAAVDAHRVADPPRAPLGEVNRLAQERHPEGATLEQRAAIVRELGGQA